MKRLGSTIPQIAALLGAILISACTTKASDLVTQDRFAFPQGDYEHRGHVFSERKYTKFLTAPEFTREVFLDLQQDALSRQPDADIIVNYLISSSVFQPPLVPFYMATFRLEGDAMKLVESGGQIYHNSPNSSPSSPTRTN